jgi:hypothetical protein
MSVWKYVWFAHLIARMVWLIRWNSKIDFEKVKREGTEVFSFVLRERHFVEICAWFVHLMKRMS